jgi:hypothetical protein
MDFILSNEAGFTASRRIRFRTDAHEPYAPGGEAAGMSYDELCMEIVNLALKRYEGRNG